MESKVITIYCTPYNLSINRSTYKIFIVLIIYFTKEKSKFYNEISKQSNKTAQYVFIPHVVPKKIKEVYNIIKTETQSIIFCP